MHTQPQDSAYSNLACTNSSKRRVPVTETLLVQIYFMPTPVTADYRVDAAALIEASRVMRLAAIEDLVELALKDAAITVGFTNLWKTANDDAEAAPTDEQLDDMLTQKTEAVEAKMKNCRDHFQDSKYFSELAFPNQKTIWNEFGFNDYDEVRDSQDKMTGFMKRLNLTQEKYKVQLIAIGYPQIEIDKSETLRGELEALNAAQDLLKKTNVGGTQTRITLNNIVYNTYMVRVGKLGKMVWKNDFAKYQRYLLPNGSEPAEVISVQGNVTGTPGGAPLQAVQIRIGEIPGFLIETDALGNYQIGGLISGNYTISYSIADYTEQIIVTAVTAGTPFTQDVVLVHV